MSRSGYSEDIDNWDLIRFRGQVASAFRGRRGQDFLREMLAALDALPDKRLIAEELIDDTGAVCAIGSVGKARGIDMTNLDPYKYEQLAATFGIARQMVQEIEYENDDYSRETPEQRFYRIRAWVVSQICVRPEELIEAKP